MSAGVLTVVEGATDLPYARRLLHHVGSRPGTPLVQRGHGRLDLRLREQWNRSSNTTAMLVLRDLDPHLGHECPPALVTHLLGEVRRAPALRVRIAVREIEAWVLADHMAVSSYFAISKARIPPEPDMLAAPKETLVALCRRSRSRAVREGMVPTPASKRAVGAGYEGFLLEFAAVWRPDRAADRSPSLARSIAAMRVAVERGLWPSGT